jgi:hypothetical protein
MCKMYRQAGAFNANRMVFEILTHAPKPIKKALTPFAAIRYMNRLGVGPRLAKEKTNENHIASGRSKRKKLGPNEPCRSCFDALQYVAPAAQAPVNLGAAGNFVILAKAGISTVPTSVITGDIGVSPIGSSAITGFALNLTAGSAFATSAQVSGKVYAPAYAAPTPANLITAIGDMQTAYTDAAGRTIPDFTELGAGQIGGLTLVPGLYK